jgi:uncharacterized protein YndB with AHSA1/START domain
VAHNTIFVHASPEAVFRVLSDARCYGIWVVGSSDIRRADTDWPAARSAFDHTVGTGPLKLADHTEVVAADPPRFLQLLAHARPLPSALVTLRLTPRGSGTHVDMHEDLAAKLPRILLWPLTQPSIYLRNAESLRRLKGLAEGTIAWPTGTPEPGAARGPH